MARGFLVVIAAGADDWYNSLVPKTPAPVIIFKSVLSQLLVVGSYLLLAAPAHAQTQPWSGVCVADEAGIVGNGDVATIQGLQCLIANVLTVALTVIGLAGFVMIIIGAFRYMLSGGNTKTTESARNTITYAIIGMIVALSAFILLNLISAFTGVDVIKIFNIPSGDY